LPRARWRDAWADLLHLDKRGVEFYVKASRMKAPRALRLQVERRLLSRTARVVPNTQGVIVQSNATNGNSLAVMESATVTILRTGAATERS
jgi:ornithine cyclodeaminase/alanine dehydrogenase-like protein (mu-crystallin family)